MSGIVVPGCGVVSPAGWGLPAFREALKLGAPLPAKNLERPGWPNGLRVRQVPPPATRPTFLGHARLRRTSPITQYAVAAALEALGEEAALVSSGKLHLGIVFCVMSGCVNYSRRFYGEVLRDPVSASPLVFPETVFNAPASHLAALLGTPAMNYTLVGDPGAFLQGVALAAQWLAQDHVEGCLVVAAEEADWLTADAFHLFSRGVTLADGAGVLYLRRGLPGKGVVSLQAITDPMTFTPQRKPPAAVQRVREQLTVTGEGIVLVDGCQGIRRFDAPETGAWQNWTGARLSPKRVLGEGLMAAAAWQCIAAVDALQAGAHENALVSICGCNQQAMGAEFRRVRPK